MPVHPSYCCDCRYSSPLIHLGQDTGLCAVCSGVYDEQLYYMRLREHIPNFTYETVDEYLRAVDRHYALTARVR